MTKIKGWCKKRNNNLDFIYFFRSTTANPNMKKSCSLYIQTDPLFWLHIKKHEKNDQKIEEEILSLIAQHVKAVNRIYSDTAFEGKKLT